MLFTGSGAATVDSTGAGGGLQSSGDLPFYSSSSGTVSISARLNGSQNATSTTFGGPGAFQLSGAQAQSAGANARFNASGPGTLTLARPGLAHFGFVVNGGTLRLASGANFGDTRRVAVNGAGTLDLNGVSGTVDALENAAAGGGAITNSGALATFTIGNNGGTGTFTGTLSGALSLVKAGSGTQTLGGFNPPGAAYTGNTYSGSTRINADAITLGNSNALPATTDLTIGNGTNRSPALNLNGFHQTVASLASNISGAGQAVVQNSVADSTSTLTVSGAASTTFAGVIASGTGAVSLSKGGASTLTLTGANTFTGPAFVSGGTLALSNAAGALASTSLVVVGDGVGADALRLDAANQIADGAGLALRGGTFNANGRSETLGTLSLATGTASSLAMGDGASFVSFSGLAPERGTLRVLGWSGNTGGGGNDRLTFATLGGVDGNGASEGQEAQVDFVNPLGLASGTYDADQLSASGEVVPIARGGAPAVAGAIISEFRFRGASSADEFVEIANATNAPLNVGGWSIRYANTAGGEVIATIAPGTTIPPRGHLLFAGAAYSLANYGGANAAPGNVPMPEDAADDSGVALRNAAAPTPAVVDAAGFASSGAGLSEGTPLPQAPSGNGQFSFVRRADDVLPQDTDDNLADFVFVSTDGAAVSSPSSLGAPGPEGLASPPLRVGGLVVALLDPAAAPSAAPNRVRGVEQGPTSPNGTVRLRRKVTNNTGRTVTRLRFRVIRVTTRNNRAAGEADVRLLNSPGEDSVATGGGAVSVSGTTIEQPPSQGAGGGLNSSVAALATPLAPGESRNISFLLGVAATGTFNVTFSIEADTGS